MANTVHPIANEPFGKQTSVKSGEVELSLSVGRVLDPVITGEERNAVYISDEEVGQGVAFDDGTTIFVVSDNGLFAWLVDIARDYPAHIGYDGDQNAWQIADEYPGEFGADNLVAVLKRELETLLGGKKTFDGFVYLFEPDKVRIGDSYARV